MTKKVKFGGKLAGVSAGVLAFAVSFTLLFHFTFDIAGILRQQLSFLIEKKSGWKLNTATIRSGIIPGSFRIFDISLSKITPEENISFSAGEMKLNALSLKNLTRNREIRFASVSIQDPVIKGKARVKNNSGKISLPVKTEKIEVSNGKIDMKIQMKNGTLLEVEGEGNFSADNLDLKNAELKDLGKILKDGKGKDLKVKFDNSLINIESLEAKGGKVYGSGISMNVRPKKGKTGASVSGKLKSITVGINENSFGGIYLDSADIKIALDNTSPAPKLDLGVIQGKIEVKNALLAVDDIYHTGTVRHTLDLDLIKIDKKGGRFDLIEAFIRDYQGKKQAQTLKISEIQAKGDKSSVKLENLTFFQKKTGNQTGIELSIPAISGEGVKVASLLHKEVAANKVILADPAFHFDAEQTDGEAKSINNLLNQFFTSQNARGKVEACIIENGNLSLTTSGKTDTIWHRAEDFYLKSRKLELNSKHPLSAKGFELKASSVMVASHEGNFHIEGQNLDINGNTKKISGENIRVRQQHSRGEGQAYYFTSTAGSFASATSHVQKLLDRNELDLDVLNIVHPDVILELDENKLPKSCSSSPLLPKHVLEMIPFPVKIDKLEMEQGRLNFTDIVPGYANPGKLNIVDLSLTASNISNYREAGSQITLNGMLEGAELDLTLNMNLLSPEINLNYSGSYGENEMRKFNDWMYFDGVKAEKGLIREMTFRVAMTRGKASGLVRMKYEDLKLTVFNEKKQKKSRIKSFLSRFVTHNENLDKKGKKAETVQVSSEWKPEFSFMYYLWHPVKEGMVETITKDFYY